MYGARRWPGYFGSIFRLMYAVVRRRTIMITELPAPLAAASILILIRAWSNTVIFEFIEIAAPPPHHPSDHKENNVVFSYAIFRAVFQADSSMYPRPTLIFVLHSQCPLPLSHWFSVRTIITPVRYKWYAGSSLSVSIYGLECALPSVQTDDLC